MVLYKEINTFSDKDINVLKILNDYGLLEKLKEFYSHKYLVSHPKVMFPKEDKISKNIEYIFKCLDS
jgi:hypothetical protein